MNCRFSCLYTFCHSHLFRALPSKFAIRLRCAESIEWVQNLQPRLTKLEMEGGRRCLNSDNACILNLVDNRIWIRRWDINVKNSFT